MSLKADVGELSTAHAHAMDLAKTLFAQQRLLLQAYHSWRASTYNDFATAAEKQKSEYERCVVALGCGRASLAWQYVAVSICQG
jgi:hypothetical protein